jgi:UDP-N-acetylmuramate dehydrogenase
MKSTVPLKELRTVFGARLQEHVRMANYTTAHVGGPADALIIAQSAQELEEAVQTLWKMSIPFRILGSGSNILFSDAGYRGVILINRTRNLRVEAHSTTIRVRAESGTNLGTIARQVAQRGLSGLEWASTVPGSLGGAVYGNAGAFGSDMHSSLILAEILHPVRGKEVWPVERLQYSYRSSILKRSGDPVVILAAEMKLTQSTVEAVKGKMEGFSTQRRRTQPPGASMGSTFRNPPGDYAGRLIEAAGLKGQALGGAEISQLHANFIISQPGATAADIWGLIELVRRSVLNKFGVELELEIECLGEWPDGVSSVGSLPVEGND